MAEAGFLDVPTLIADTQFVYTLPARGEQLLLRKIHEQELAMLAARGSVLEYEGQHDFSARIVAIASVTPPLTVAEARCLGADALHAATAVLRFSGLVPEDAEGPAEAGDAP